MYLITIKLLTIFPLFVIIETNKQQNCDNSICNYEALCTLDNGNPTCKCVEQFFEGEFCSKPTEHCLLNPCQNGGTCLSYPGHYNCECLAGFAGQTCTSEQDAVKGLHLHYNHIAPFGSEQSLMLIVQYLGAVETLMEFYTADYIIDGIAFTSTSGHFTESNDLKSIAKELRIKHSANLPFNSGFYRISKASFWKPGLNSMTLDLTDFGTSGESFFRANFNIFVYDPTGLNCFPEIHLPHCLNPRKPLHMDIQTFNFIEPIVDKRCKLDSQLSIKWSVRNYINTVVLHKFPKQPDGKTLTIPPYTMWFNYRDDFVQSYLIQGDVLEVGVNKSPISKTTLRCYVFVDSKPTTASILGGAYREVNSNKEFVLDGSISRDYARRPNRDQSLQYLWSCTSDDTQSDYCLANMGNESRLIVPAKALQIQKTYMYTLLVRSSINIYSTHKSFQTIKAVSYDSLLIYFTCLRNCEHGQFSAGKVIHLKLECIQCPPGDITYLVRNTFGIEVANSHRVILIEDTEHQVYLKAEANLGTLKGRTSIKLTLNQPPKRGSCTISPPSGIEYETLFKISCFGYVDEDSPIDYKFWVGNNILDHSNDETLTTRLFPTSGEICEIRIKICDDIGACTEVQLEVSLKRITNSRGKWLELLSQKGTNLKEHIDSGDMSAAFILIRTVIRNMTPSDGQEIVKHVVESFRNVKANRLLVVEQFLSIGNNLLASMIINSESALSISKLFLKVIKGFLHSIRNQEILELQVESQEMMMGNLVEAIAKTAIEVEEFPIVHDAESIPPEDPFTENYSDYGELNIKDVVHISNWLQSFQRLHRCLQVMGVVSAFVQLPGETPLVIKRAGITSMSLVLDKSESMSLSWNASSTYIDFPKEFIKSFGTNEIAIQTSIFERNPLWWNPEQYTINSEILSLGAYSRNLASLNSKTTRSYFSFYMQLKRNAMEEILTHGSLQSNHEMLVFDRVLPANSVLVVKFLPLSSDIRVLLLMEQVPRTFMFKDAIVVQTSTESTTLYLINNSSKQRKGFLAISSKFRVEFSFTLTIRICSTWHTQSLEWTSKYCSVGYQTNATHIHCSCWHLSIFGAKVYPTFVITHRSTLFFKHLDTNYRMLSMISIIVLLMIILLGLAWRRDIRVAANAVILDQTCTDRKPTNEYVVTIYTNGHRHAGTTSNVAIKIHGSLAKSQTFTLYSRPGQSIFHRNAQTSFTLFLPIDLGVLQSVSLKLDGFGRYPKWNCHMVKIRDEIKKILYIFMVNRWIQADSEPVLITLAKEEELQSRCRIFKNYLANIFANFYAQQSFCSRRLYGQLTAMEKASVFIFKSCISVMGTLIFFGPTTIFTYELEREMYYSMLLNFQKLICIACVCHIIGVVGAEVLYYLISKIKGTTSNLNYNLVLR